MTTVVVVKKAGQVAIAADTLVTFGDTKLGHRFEDNSKIFRIDTPGGPSYVGMAGTVAHFPALRKAITSLPLADRKLGSKDEVFDTFIKLHPLLKETFFLQTKEDDNDPYESSQFSVVVATPPASMACTATGSVRVQGILGHRSRSGLRAGRRRARSMPKPKLPVKWPKPVSRPAASSTKTRAARSTCSRSG